MDEEAFETFSSKEKSLRKLKSKFSACNDRADGLYELSACSAQFLTCSGGIARIMDCPFGLVYNTPIEACDYSHEVASCNEGSGAAAADVPESSSTSTSTTEMPSTTQKAIIDCQEGAAVGSEFGRRGGTKIDSKLGVLGPKTRNRKSLSGIC